jgi:6-phosphogluconate dehydrogenase
MQIGFIGLGRMGANMVRRLVRDGHEVVARPVESRSSVLILASARSPAGVGAR